MAHHLSDPSLFHFSNDEDGSDTTDFAQLVSRRPGKTPGACVDCKSVKVRCEVVPGERKCKRCQAKNLPCRPRERKKRKASDTHEQLQERSHEQDIRIRNLLMQYDQLRSEQKIHEWMSKAPPTQTGDPFERQRHIKWIHKGKSPEQAVASQYSTPGNAAFTPPEIVKHCALYPEDITELFSIYFTRANPYFSLLDEDYHTPEKVIRNSPFLFTVICAVASRHYTSRPGLYQVAMEFARDFAGKALVEGYRSVDVCQAYLIMSVYPIPKKKWAEDRSWLLMGVAIRMAIELELNQPPPPMCDEREALNRVRTWLNCYCVDGSHAIQFGKMPMLRLDDYLARNSSEWYHSSPLNTAFDVHLVAYVQLIILMAKWRAYIDGPNPPSNIEEIMSSALETQNILAQEMDNWSTIYARELNYMPLPICAYRGNTTRLIASYLRLVVLLSAFQHMKQEDFLRDSVLLGKCVDCARTVIQIALENLSPTGYLRYAMDANFLYMSFAAAFLINLFRPRYTSLLTDNLKREIIRLVTRLITMLSSREVALDGRHTPALYSRFLSSLMAKHNLSLENSLFVSSTNHSPNSREPDRHQTPPEGFYWPDVQLSDTIGNEPDISRGTFAYQFSGMDFSLSHFIKTVTQTIPGPFDLEMPRGWDAWGAASAESSTSQFDWTQSPHLPGVWTS